MILVVECNLNYDIYFCVLAICYLLSDLIDDLMLGVSFEMNVEKRTEIYRTIEPMNLNKSTGYSIEKDEIIDQ